MSKFQTMTMPELSMWYIANVGYDLVEDDPSITIENYRSICEDIERETIEAEQNETPKPRDQFKEAIALLTKAESFIAGFEGDESQEGVDELLAEIRELLTQTPPTQNAIPVA